MIRLNIVGLDSFAFVSHDNASDSPIQFAPEKQSYKYYVGFINNCANLSEIYQTNTFSTCGGRSTPMCNGTLSGALGACCDIIWFGYCVCINSLLDVDANDEDGINMSDVLWWLTLLSIWNCRFVCGLPKLFGCSAPAEPLLLLLLLAKDNFRSFSRRSCSWRSSSCNCSRCNCCLSCVRDVGVAVLNVGLQYKKRKRRKNRINSYQEFVEFVKWKLETLLFLSKKNTPDWSRHWWSINNQNR